MHQSEMVGGCAPNLKMRKPRSGFAVINLREESQVIVIGGNDGRV
jgi:hypothetical protein